MLAISWQELALPEEEAMVAADVMENTVMEVTNRIQADDIDNIAILFRLQIK